MKIMAIDYGTKRVGIASTDESGKFALPRAVLPNDDGLLEEVLRFVDKDGIELIVIGESRNFQGGENKIMQDARKFAQILERRGGVEVVFHPELLTTIEARQLQGNTEFTDASAASLILKSFIESGYNNSDD